MSISAKIFNGIAEAVKGFLFFIVNFEKNLKLMIIANIVLAVAAATWSNNLNHISGGCCYE